MRISTVQAAGRFDNTEFSNEVVDGMALSLTTAYTCPQCGTQIGFHKRDFEDGARQHHSNLDSEVARAFGDYAHEHLPGTQDFLDWACPRCGLAARIYVRFWAGGKHGDAGVTLLNVIETRPATDEGTA
jgi:predicted RNA-binding Zn-ribbon protein involved in translation (DUF1610 family)